MQKDAFLSYLWEKNWLLSNKSTNHLSSQKTSLLLVKFMGVICSTVHKLSRLFVGTILRKQGPVSILIMLRTRRLGSLRSWSWTLGSWTLGSRPWALPWCRWRLGTRSWAFLRTRRGGAAAFRAFLRCLWGRWTILFALSWLRWTWKGNTVRIDWLWKTFDDCTTLFVLCFLCG